MMRAPRILPFPPNEQYATAEEVLAHRNECARLRAQWDEEDKTLYAFLTVLMALIALAVVGWNVALYWTMFGPMAAVKGMAAEAVAVAAFWLAVVEVRRRL